MSNHEPVRSYRAIAASSNRTFGFAFACFFLIVTVWPWLRHGQPLRLWAMAPSAAFLGLSLFAEQYLAPLNRLWFQLGLKLHAVVSPVIMGLLFFCAVTPTGLLMRAFGNDILMLRRNEDRTYWIERSPAGPAEGSMKNQF
ncbi:SxtJ family membrane protein [Methylocystis bryophila]|uniref:SxtJ n=1 Tax=Methylocystis bryophila TaxID=655015 RepID=A0A1W6MT17_9HYPH|nr:SxtJ family membrane protein [Methylocystis bryophila]ARN80702.1 hypothetical protein B1812_06020 [Methylocystis bryophila]BDV40772.1 hypothetical protein DSM21852_40250 [Methylocystis bryophila]